MNNPNTTSSRFIVPLFVLAGLLTTVTGCSTSQPRPVAEPVPPAPQAASKTESAPVAEKTIRVKSSYPRQYTVKKGDTLWDISSLFLQDPWYWPEIWQKNPQLQNPHLIYPGDVLTLVYVNGQPQVRVNEPQRRVIEQTIGNGLPVVKLSPGVRAVPLEANIANIPGDAIRQFLSKPRVVTKEELENAPRIIGSEDDHLVLGAGNRVYIRGEIDKERVRFSVFNPGDPLRDPQTNELLGYEAKYAGEVRITTYGDPSSGDLTFTEREILIGDRLLPEDKSKVDNLYFPRIPEGDVEAQIISLYDALFGVAQLQIVVINKGERDGMEVGHLLATHSEGTLVKDHYDKHRSEPVKLPNERSGLIMVFKTFDRVSYALTLESKRVIHKNDFALTPQF